MKKYILEIWVNTEKRDIEGIKRQLDSKLKRFSDAIVKVEVRENATVILVQSNNLSTLSCCHNLEEWSRDEIYIGRDDSSNEARIKAYPILAEIELSLRHFINRAMTEVYGFDWWEKIEFPLSNKTKRIEKKQVGAKKHPPLDFSFFEDLLSFVEATKPKWSTSERDALNKLYTTISDESPELTSKLYKYMEKKDISFWDDIFRTYFTDLTSWTEIKDQLASILDIRNMVAHHRGFFTIQQVEKLKKTRTEVNSTLAAAKRELSSDEKEKVKRTMRSIGMVRQLVEFLPLAEAAVIEMRYLQSKNYEKISEELGISRQEIEKIEKNALKDLRKIPSLLQSIFAPSQ